MKINKKASRNPNLYVFSHEHHHGLVFAARLKKASITDAAIIQKYILRFWNKALKNHFRKEEELFLDLINQKDIKKQFTSDHLEIRTLINSIQNEKDDLNDKAKLLSDLLKAHIKFEEKILFPWLQDNLSDNALKTIGDTLKRIEVKADDFEPHFWK